MTSEKPEADRSDAGAEAPDVGIERDPAEDQPDGAVDASDAELAAREDGVSGEMEALRDRYLRLAAEFENFRRRTDRERVDARDRAQGQLVEKLLEALDDLQRVARAGGEGSTLESLVEGVRMVERKFVRILEGAGLEPVEAEGEAFDPEMHEALMVTPTEVADEDHTVGEVFQRGYRFRGGLLRPARVQVRKFEG
jgi:molecular chaperone GrpE